MKVILEVLILAPCIFFTKEMQIRPEIWPEINKNAFVVIKKLLLPRDNVVQMMYADVIEQATLVGTKKISIDFQGLQSSCHSKFFKAMSHKLQTKLAKQSGGEHVMEINKIHIPYNPKGKLLRTPDLQIVAKSCPSSVQLTLNGNGCMIFLLFHLQKVFESFTERLTIKITDCYTFPSQSSQATEAEKSSLPSSSKDAGETISEKLYAENHTSTPSSPASPIFTKKNKQKQVKDLNSDMKGLLIEDISEKDTPIIRKDREYGYKENEEKKMP